MGIEPTEAIRKRSLKQRIERGGYHCLRELLETTEWTAEGRAKIAYPLVSFYMEVGKNIKSCSQTSIEWNLNTQTPSLLPMSDRK